MCANYEEICSRRPWDSVHKNGKDGQPENVMPHTMTSPVLGHNKEKNSLRRGFNAHLKTNRLWREVSFSTVSAVQCSDVFVLQVQTLPHTQHVPDHQVGVESMQAEGHPGCGDAVSGVQHMGGQRTGVCCCHDLLETCGQVRRTCTDFCYSLNWLHNTTVWNYEQKQGYNLIFLSISLSLLYTISTAASIHVI